MPVSFGTAIATAMGTASTNDMSPDGYTWADINAFIVDKFSKLIVSVQKNGGGAHSNNFVYSNNQGTSWNDGLSENFLNRASMAYDTTNDVLHILWIGTDMSSGEGFIYRRYTITRDGSNNITAFTRDATTNLQIDFDTSASTTMVGDFPRLLFLNDAAYGTFGALVAIWSVEQGNGTGGKIQGYEYRASMVVLGSTANAGGTAGNWVSLTGTPDSTTLGTGSTPAIAYNRLAGRTGAGNIINGSFAYLRKQANSHAKDIYFFFYDANGGLAIGQWSYRRIQWASGTNNWANGLTASQVMSLDQVAGSDTGYNLKYQLITQTNEDTTNDFVYVGAPVWLSNALGDTQCLWRVGSSDVPSATTAIYSAGGPHVYAPTQDLSFDNVSGQLIVTYDISGAVDTNYGYYAVYSGLTVSQVGRPIYTTHGTDIPLLLAGRYTGGTTPAMIGAFRWTLNTPTPPYTGFFFSIPITTTPDLAGPVRPLLGAPIYLLDVLGAPAFPVFGAPAIQSFTAGTPTPPPGPPEWTGPLGVQVAPGEISTFWNAHMTSQDIIHPIYGQQSVLAGAPGQKYIGLLPSQITTEINDAINNQVPGFSAQGIQWGDETTGTQGSTVQINRLINGWEDVLTQPPTFQTTLSATIGAGDATLTVPSTTNFSNQGFPTGTGNFTITIGTEQIICQNQVGSGLTWNLITRGANGTVAAGHTAGVNINLTYHDPGVTAMATQVHAAPGSLKLLYGPLQGAIQNSSDTDCTNLLNAGQDATYLQAQRFQDPANGPYNVAAWVATVSGLILRMRTLAPTKLAYIQVQVNDFRSGNAPYTDPNYVINLINGISQSAHPPDAITIFFFPSGVTYLENTIKHFRP